jgi:endonuclease/exonuclease/phosphatase family metal-dependent hydrolase
MAIKIAAWNIEGRLNGYTKHGRGTAAHILASIAALDADVLALPECFIDSIASGVDDQLHELGYTYVETSYEDYGRENEKYMKGKMHMRILSRLPLSKVEYIRPGDVRNLIACYVTLPTSSKKICIIATHLDDRLERTRLKQVVELVEYINTKNIPVVMLGDFNAMWHEGRGRLINSWLVRTLARYIPHEDFRYMATRVTDMATGTVLNELTTHTDLRDADSSHRPTATPKLRYTPFMPSICLIQIDHMLVSPEINVSDFTVEKDGGSDHRAISATLSAR